MDADIGGTGAAGAHGVQQLQSSVGAIDCKGADDGVPFAPSRGPSGFADRAYTSTSLRRFNVTRSVRFHVIKPLLRVMATLAERFNHTTFLATASRFGFTCSIFISGSEGSVTSSITGL